MHNDSNDDAIACHKGTRVRKNHTSKRGAFETVGGCLLYTSPSPRDGLLSRMPSSA